MATKSHKTQKKRVHKKEYGDGILQRLLLVGDALSDRQDPFLLFVRGLLFLWILYYYPSIPCSFSKIVAFTISCAERGKMPRLLLRLLRLFAADDLLLCFVSWYYTLFILVAATGRAVPFVAAMLLFCFVADGYWMRCDFLRLPDFRGGAGCGVLSASHIWRYALT